MPTPTDVAGQVLTWLVMAFARPLAWLIHRYPWKDPR
jgi:hypothetical protein